ncbi:hypothetical protein [Halorubrum sp. DTA46]|uniref:hypothetical protein n=1 Tax=Halorubrum sp. DTA46 TaxID=3402162 RepID=UPI003AAFEE59
MRLSPALLAKLKDASWPVVALVAAVFLGVQFLRGEAFASGFGWVLVVFLGMTLAFVGLAGWVANRE